MRDAQELTVCVIYRTLRSLLKSETQNHERRERQVRVETNAKLFALEVRASLCEGMLQATTVF